MKQEENNKKKFTPISKFGLGNFKGFRDVQEIEIAPITLIFGQNSGGKTSLLQSILSLSQSFYEIEKGKFQLSGTKVDSGTFETVLNNETNQKEIIIETSSRFKFESFPHLANKVYLIESFRALKYSKIRFYINSIKEYSGAFITKLEIVFSDYLEGYKLSFKRTNSYVEGISPNYVKDYYPLFSDINNSNYATYELDNESGKTLKIITEKCFENLCSSFKKMFSEKKKGDWYDEKLKSYRVDFGPLLFEKKRLASFDPKFISLIKHAAIASGAILNRENDRRIRNYSFKVKEIIHLNNGQKSKYFFKILNEFSDKIFKSSIELYEQNFINIKLVINLKSTPVPRRVSGYESTPSLDRLIGNVLFTSKFTDLSNSFFKNNPLHIIDDLKDSFLEELINQFNNKSSNKKIFEKYKKLKEIITETNFYIEDCKREFMQILDSINGDYRLVKNRQIIRDFLLQRPFNTIEKLTISTSNIDILGEVLLDIKKNKIDTWVYSMRGDREPKDWNIEPLKEIVYEIKDLRESYLSKFNNNSYSKVELAKNYEYKLDQDLIYIKSQINKILILSFLFKRASKYIQSELRTKLVESFAKNNLFDSLFFGKEIIFENLNFLIGTGEENDDFSYDSEKIDNIQEAIKDYVNNNYPNIDNYELDEYFEELGFYEISNHLMPSPFVSQNIVPPRLNHEVIHLGPSRPGAKRFYTISDIENASPDDVAYFLKLHKQSNKNNKLSIKNLNSYLKSLDIVESISPDKSSDSRYDFESILVNRDKKSKKVNLADTGFGLSQLFPIIINAVIKKVNTILVQQPETHLHPRLQAEVGSILVDSVLGFDNKKDFTLPKKYWLVETHSEIMLLRILKRIRNGEFDSKNLKVYYVDQNKDKGSIIKSMHVSDDGEMITQWPKGFFSNDIDEMFDI